MENEAIDLLTQGSVWKKNAGQKAGRQAKLLFLTNMTLPARIREKHPAQVIYVDDENNVYNRSIEEFTTQYSFYNVDGELESRLEALLVFNENDVEEETDEELAAESEGPVEDSENGADAVVARSVAASYVKDAVAASKSFADSLLEDEDEMNDVDAVEDEGQLKDPTVVQFSFGNSAETSATLGDYDLGPALVAYSQEPDRANSMIKHRLLFALNSNVTLPALKEAFTPNDDLNTVDIISVVGPHFVEVVPWTDYLGVYPEMAAGRAFATVILGEDVTPAPEDDSVQEGPAVDFSLPEMQEILDVVSTEVPQVLDVETQRQIAEDVAQELAAAEEIPPPVVELPETPETPAAPQTHVQHVQHVPHVTPAVQAQVANLIQNIAPKPQQ